MPGSRLRRSLWAQGDQFLGDAMLHSRLMDVLEMDVLIVVSSMPGWVGRAVSPLSTSGCVVGLVRHGAFGG